MIRKVSLLAALALTATVSAAQQPRMTSQFIYEKAPFPSCHASTLAETPTGLVAAWFGGQDEKAPDVGIWVSRRQRTGWTPPQEVVNGVQYVDGAGKVHRHPTWNPVLHQVPAGPLLLFYKAGPSPDTWWGLMTSSMDGGKTWSRPHRLPEGILGPIKNKPVLLRDSTLLCPTSTEHDGWKVHFELTRDNGATWTRIGPVADPEGFQPIQPTLLQLGEDRLLAICRSGKKKKVSATESRDGGRTWSPMFALDLPHPNSGLDGITLKDGRHLLVYNHTERGRAPLNVAVSRDGRTWKSAVVLENVPGEYSYPAIIQSADGMVHITYTWKRERIRYVTLDPTSF